MKGDGGYTRNLRETQEVLVDKYFPKVEDDGGEPVWIGKGMEDDGSRNDKPFSNQELRTTIDDLKNGNKGWYHK